MKKKLKKNFKQKSFFFEDYTESKINNENKNDKIKISLNRTIFLLFTFCSLALILNIKIFYTSLSPENFFFQKRLTKTLLKKDQI